MHVFIECIEFYTLSVSRMYICIINPISAGVLENQDMLGGWG